MGAAPGLATAVFFFAEAAAAGRTAIRVAGIRLGAFDAGAKESAGDILPN